MATPAAVNTVTDVLLSTNTINIVQPNLALSLAEMGHSPRPNGSSEVEHTANHLRIIEAPGVTTDGAPSVVVENLNTTLKRRYRAVDQQTHWVL